MKTDLPRRAAAEFAGSALLLAAVVGSGIMGERLAGGNAGLALLANSLATGAALAVLLLVFGPVSGAHFNPAVSLALGERRTDLPAYLLAQTAGAAAGVVLANLMFDLAPVTLSTRPRGGASAALSEAVATFGLLVTIAGVARSRPAALPFAVGAYITAAYWFTASTSFANPAVTLARSLTDTFTGIRPADVPAFIAAQLAGAAGAVAFSRWLFPREAP
jgi:glycerol uptake facilitator-like aquaporin